MDAERKVSVISRVTVLMAVYNAMPYLRDATESILQQTFSEFRFVVVDDGSTDTSREYLSGLTDRRIDLICLDKNGGQGAARNRGLKVCDSEFLALMDADDISLPTRLEAQLRFLDAHADVGMVGTEIAYVGSQGNQGMRVDLPRDHEQICENLLAGRHAICHPSIMCRTSLLRRIGGYRVNGSGEDWDMFLRMGELSRLANLGGVLHLYRAHSGNVSIRHAKEIRKQIRYACDCARRRAAGTSEMTLDEFLVEERSRHVWQRYGEQVDIEALRQYRLAVGDILQGRKCTGYCRIACASLCSPVRTAHRLHRILRLVLRPFSSSTPRLPIVNADATKP